MIDLLNNKSSLREYVRKDNSKVGISSTLASALLLAERTWVGKGAQTMQSSLVRTQVLSGDRRNCHSPERSELCPVAERGFDTEK